jgi:pyridoxamine 5'-phosphate oxidase
MDFRDCITFANENSLSYFATSEAGQPRVRPLGLWFADDKGFHYQTHADKALCKQLKEDNKVEACFYNPRMGGGLGTVLRVAGEIEFIDDLEYKKRVFEDRAHIMESYGVETPEDPRVVVFRIYKGEAYFWTGEYNLREPEIEKIPF